MTTKEQKLQRRLVVTQLAVDQLSRKWNTMAGRVIQALDDYCAEHNDDPNIPESYRAKLMSLRRQMAEAMNEGESLIGIGAADEELR